MGASKSPGFLVATDVDAVQSYLFASSRLAAIAGASQIVWENDERIRELAGEGAGDAIFSAGGTALAIFEEDEKDDAKERAAAFARAAEEQLAAASVSGSLSASEPVDLAAYGTFGEARDAAIRSLEERKRSGPQPGEIADHPLVRRCDWCGREPAVMRTSRGDDEYAIGEACKTKDRARRDHDRRGGWLSRLDSFDTPAREALQGRLPESFDELAGGDYLGIVVADVNGVGLRLRGIHTREQYENFSEKLQQALDGALAAAVKAAIARTDSRGTLPVEVLFHGGDDVVAACRGALALSFARTLAETFRSRATDDWAGTGGLGMSAGVVLVRGGFPFLAAHRLALRLLGEAKRAAREAGWNEGAVDFAIVSESQANADALLADRALSDPDGKAVLHLTGRPYRVCASGPRSIGGLAGACKLLQKGFPRSRLFDLRQACAAESFEKPRGRVITQSDILQWQQQLHDEIGRWTDRAARRAEARKLWADVRRSLRLEENGFYAGGLRTPLGDLADLVGMWEG